MWNLSHMPLLKRVCILRLNAADSNHTIIRPIITAQVIANVQRFNISMKTNYLRQHVQAVINRVRNDTSQFVLFVQKREITRERANAERVV